MKRLFRYYLTSRLIILAALVGVLVSGPVMAAADDEMRGRRLSGAEITRFYSGAKVNVQKTEDYRTFGKGVYADAELKAQKAKMGVWKDNPGPPPNFFLD